MVIKFYNKYNRKQYLFHKHSKNNIYTLLHLLKHSYCTRGHLMNQYILNVDLFDLYIMEVRLRVNYTLKFYLKYLPLI